MHTIDLEKIKDLRHKKGLTLLDMAQALGYESSTAYHYLEQGSRCIKANQVAIIAEMLDVQIQDLYTIRAAG